MPEAQSDNIPPDTPSRDDLFYFESRPSDSSYVDALWRTHSASAKKFISVAESHWGIVVTRMEGKIWMTVRGPETKATSADIPPDAEFFGIVFKHGTFMPILPTPGLVNNGIDLPDATRQSFWLDGSAWEFPTFDNADTFVERLVRAGLLVREPVVAAALQGEVRDLSLRSVQRKFLMVTGLTHNSIRQIERARQALMLLQQGVSILDTVEQAGYSDQPHLTRSLKQLTGQTPAQIAPVRPPQ
jgi:hypothetical protein